MGACVLEIIQLINFVFLMILYANLNPDSIKGIVHKMFTIYWITFICSLFFGMFFALGVKNEDVEIGLKMFLSIMKLVSMIVISVNLYPKLSKLGKMARISYSVMTATLIILFVTFILMFIRSL